MSTKCGLVPTLLFEGTESAVLCQCHISNDISGSMDIFITISSVKWTVPGFLGAAEIKTISLRLFRLYATLWISLRASDIFSHTVLLRMADMLYLGLVPGSVVCLIPMMTDPPVMTNARDVNPRT